MAAKEVSFETQKMVAGVNVLADAVKVTLGPKGRNVVFERPYGAPPVITKDGVSVAKEIELEDKFENMGAQMVKQVAAKTADVAGDGTTTATVLAQSIVQEGMKYVAAGMNPMDLKRGIDKAVAVAVTELKNMSKPCSTDEEVAQVGSISANSDTDIGNIIAQAMSKVGKQGVITVEDGKSLQNELDVVEGMQFDRGYLSPFFVTDETKQTATFDNPYILLYNGKISNVKELVPLLETIIKANRALVIIAEDVEGEALATMVVNKMKGILKACAVKAPSFGTNRRAILSDIAVLTGGNVIDVETGGSLESIAGGDLGQAQRIEISKDHTTIIGGAGTDEAIAARVAELTAQFENTEAGFERDKIQERRAKLSGGVAIIKVGAATEVEMKEKKDRVDDALHATRAAVEEGIVPGGGVALLRTKNTVQQLVGDNADQNAGIAIVVRALEAPIRAIAANAGDEPSVIVRDVLSNNSDPSFGYNAATGEYVNLVEAGVVDPTKVTRSALQNAASVAGLMLTTACMIATIPNSNEQQQPQYGY